jgi:NAD(P)-dependent dehydrogenase (short-subunit alcohol dehydrogenase family)
MTDAQRVAVVTGANRGIGLEVCRQLAGMGLQVVLTSRDEQRGGEAVDLLACDGLRADYCRLDASDRASIGAAAEFVGRSYGRCDVLINNAGVFPDRTERGTSILEAARDVLAEAMEINAFGPVFACQAFVPLMRRNDYGRIVNVSSGMGQLSEMSGQWPGYRLSKTALNAATRILADELKGTNILVNSACPGWVRTDMGGRDAERDVTQGAEGLVWLATLPDGGPSGGFFRDGKAIPW